jgi:molybdopterin-guanine dinucleotide biosynthesis protein A
MDAEGWVLAGGRSSRMGRDKAAVPLAGRPLLDHMLGKLEALGLKARVAGLRETAGSRAEVMADAYPGCGPLSGMETALRHSRSELVLVLGVDLPLLEIEFLAWLLERAASTGAVATIPKLLGEPQPLCGVYRRELLPWVTDALQAGDYKVMRMIERTAATAKDQGGAVDVFDSERLAATGAWSGARPCHLQWMNCNTPGELGQAESLLARAPML